MVNQFRGSADGAAPVHAGLRARLRPLGAEGDGDGPRRPRAHAAASWARTVASPAQDEEFVLSHADSVEASGFVAHLKLPHYVDFQSELTLVRALRAEGQASMSGLQLRLSRRADEADAPAGDSEGHRHPRLSGALRQPRDAAVLRLGHRRRPGDGDHHRPGGRPEGHRPGRRRHDQRGEHPAASSRGPTGVRTTTRTDEATLIQTRHRIPETPLREGQILVFQVPIPEPLRWLEPRETVTRTMHALEEYGVMHVRLYEDITRHGKVATDLRLPGRRERPLPHAAVADPEVRQPEARRQSRRSCSSAPAARSASTRCRRTRRCGASTSRIIPSRSSGGTRPAPSAGRREAFLDEIVVDDKGGRVFVCSDTDYCSGRTAARGGERERRD